MIMGILMWTHSKKQYSPIAQCLFGRTIRAVIPVHRDKYKPHRTWTDILDKRERAVNERYTRMRKFWHEHTKPLSPLRVGDFVRVQNQFGPNPLKWDRTGVIVEVKQHDQYVVKVDGSNRCTLRNRKFLRRYEPIIPPTSKTSLMERLRHLSPHHMAHRTDVPSNQMIPRLSPPHSVCTPPANDSYVHNEPEVSNLPPGQGETIPPVIGHTVPNRPKDKKPRALSCLDPYNKGGLVGLAGDAIQMYK